MEIGIDDIDEEYEVAPQDEPQEGEPQEEPQDSANEEQPEQNDTEDYIDFLLRERGIEDKSKIKFENEDGEVEETNWDSLNNEDKLNILKSSEVTPETGLDDSEIQLINAIRNSGMSPDEYLNYVSTQSIQNYVANTDTPHYEIDQYNDDELFLMDFISRTDSTDEEAMAALEQAKSNETLFKKQVDSIRNEYAQLEQENLMQAQMEQEQAQQQQFAEFSDQIVDEINDLKDIQGFELNMDSDDMQEIYDFITGQDAAGNNYFAKSLADPKLLVKTAWLTLNGDRMINDITDYFQKEITNVRRESYKKGVEDTQKKMNKQSNVIFRTKSQAPEYDAELDDF